MFFISWETQSLTYIATWSLIGWTQMLRTRRSTALTLWLFAPFFDRLSPILTSYWDKVVSRLPMTSSAQVAASKKTLGAEEVVELAEENHGLWWRFWRKVIPLLVGALIVVGSLTGVLFLGIAFSVLGFVVIAVVMPVLAAISIRVVSTIIVACGHPLEALRAIPRNWRRVAWSLDLFEPLEFVPRHRLLLYFRRLKTADDTEEGELFARFRLFHVTRGGLEPVVITIFCVLAVAFLVWIPLSFHNPPSSQFRELMEQTSRPSSIDSASKSSQPSRPVVSDSVGISSPPLNTDSEWVGPNNRGSTVGSSPAADLSQLFGGSRSSITPDNYHPLLTMWATASPDMHARMKLRHFDLLNVDDWRFRIRWYAQWPVRTVRRWP